MFIAIKTIVYDLTGIHEHKMTQTMYVLPFKSGPRQVSFIAIN